ncbi:hypothetical protein LCGC14_0429850 [marine sediment metagenome]|uniref:Uncharacterized protein n=1 Tax=marine sediment metagenome TaxID=412755 RepID=A0A0F9SUJ3_9ZZZZ
MLLEKYLLVGIVLAMIFAILMTSGPGIPMLMQRYLPQDFSDRKVFRKAILLIIVAWPAMFAYIILMSDKRK